MYDTGFRARALKQSSEDSEEARSYRVFAGVLAMIGIIMIVLACLSLTRVTAWLGTDPWFGPEPVFEAFAMVVLFLAGPYIAFLGIHDAIFGPPIPNRNHQHK